jgi:hypothetical protein
MARFSFLSPEPENIPQEFLPQQIRDAFDMNQIRIDDLPWEEIRPPGCGCAPAGMD